MRSLPCSNWSSTSNSNQHDSIQYHSNQSEIIQMDRSTNIQRGIQHYDSICRVDPTNRQLVDGYTQLVIDRVNDGWSCHLVSVLFSQFPGPRPAVLERMRDELERVYSTFVTRTHRKPRTASPGELPLLIGAADLPVYKRDKNSSPGGATPSSSVR